MDETIDLKPLLDAVEAIPDKRLRNIFQSVFLSAMSCMSMQRDTLLRYSELKHYLDGNDPTPWE